jgi:ketosteroid isomerase-like protein
MVTPSSTVYFDYPAFRDAVARKDTERWAEFYAEDAEWVEYRHSAPPREPKRMVGKPAITAFLHAVAAENITIEVSQEVRLAERAAFRVICTLPDNRRIREHVILALRDGKIIHQVDLEAWD